MLEPENFVLDVMNSSQYLLRLLYFETLVKHSLSFVFIVFFSLRSSKGLSVREFDTYMNKCIWLLLFNTLCMYLLNIWLGLVLNLLKWGCMDQEEQVQGDLSQFLKNIKFSGWLLRLLQHYYNHKTNLRRLRALLQVLLRP